MNRDELYMKRALQLAQEGAGYTSPNPMVGAVIVKEGRIIGEGYHPRFGDKHAEVMAIENATESVEGATLYCNLEPCCNTIVGKKTPACSLRLIQENIRRVVIATLDPNPFMQGHGVQRLRQAGIEVTIGVLAEEATRLNESYFKFIQTGEPFVHLKIAQTLDGRIATRSGDSRWITDETARRMVHQWRATHDAVLVGIGTVLKDNPRLTVRHVEGRQPWRVVLDTHLRIPLEAHLVTDEWRERTIIFHSEAADPQKQQALQQRGVRLLTVPVTDSGLSLDAVLQQLKSLNIAAVLVEGGQRVFTRWIAERRFDKLSVFIAPRIMGEGVAAIGDLGIDSVADTIPLQCVQWQAVGSQWLVQGYRDVHHIFGILTEHLSCLPESSKKLATSKA